MIDATLDKDARKFAQALAGGPIGKRSAHMKSVRKFAEDLGHRLGRAQTRRYSDGRVMYHVAWCVLCGRVAFTGQNDDTNPALDQVCRGAA